MRNARSAGEATGDQGEKTASVLSLAMVLSQVSRERLEFYGRTRVRAPLLVGVALAVMAVLPWLTSEPVFPWRALASVLLGAAAAWLIAASVPRRERLVIDLVDNVLRRGDDALPLSRVRSVRLRTTGPVEDDSPVLRYRADLVLNDARQQRLLERPDPAGVLADLRQVLKVLQWPVESGWGLPANAAPWTEPGAGGGSGLATRAEIDFRAPRFESQRAAAATVLGSGVFTCIAMTVMMLNERRRGGHVAPLSVALAASAIGLVLLVGMALATEHVRVRKASELSIEQHVLGFAWRRFKLSPSSVRAVYLVGPDTASPRHLLFDAENRLFAVRCAGPAALKLQELLRPLS